MFLVHVVLNTRFFIGRSRREAPMTGCSSTPSRLCRTRYNTTAPMYGVSLTSGQPVTIVQKFPDLLQQVVFEVTPQHFCQPLLTSFFIPQLVSGLRKFRVRRCQRGMYPDVCALPVSSDTLGPSHADWPRLRLGGERLRLQAQVRVANQPGSWSYGFHPEAIDR